MKTNLYDTNTSISQIISFINTKNFKLSSSKNEKIRNFQPITLAKKGDMTFCSSTGKTGYESISSSRASLIICSLKLQKKFQSPKSSLIFVENPRLWFLRCVKKFLNHDSSFDKEKTAIIKSKHIGKNFKIGPHSYIGSNVKIGNNVRIGSNVSITGKTTIGNNVIIHESVVIGTEGLSFEKNEKSEWEKFPQIRGVQIHDDVEIFANACVIRGTLTDTIVEKGTKIGPLVNIAHNVKIGKNCIIMPQCMIGGSVVLDANVQVYTCASIRDGIKIGKSAKIGMGSVVTKNVSKGITVMGVPAKQYKK